MILFLYIWHYILIFSSYESWKNCIIIIVIYYNPTFEKLRVIVKYNKVLLYLELDRFPSIQYIQYSILFLNTLY